MRVVWVFDVVEEVKADIKAENALKEAEAAQVRHFQFVDISIAIFYIVVISLVVQWYIRKPSSSVR